MSEELTRFPITPQERHETARSFDDVAAVPEENLPRQEERPQDKPLPPDARAEDQPDKPDAPPGDDEAGGGDAASDD